MFKASSRRLALPCVACGVLPRASDVVRSMRTRPSCGSSAWRTPSVGVLVSGGCREFPLDRSGPISISPSRRRPWADARGADRHVSHGGTIRPDASRETRCGGRLWIVIAILIPAALFLLATAIIKTVYGAPIGWRSVGRPTGFPELPRSVYWLANLVFYGFGEEVGWRGFALPRLQSHASALRASLWLAVGWAGWHVSLFTFSPGLSNLGLLGAGGWFVSVALGSILLTWLFNSSGGSVAVVAVFHAALDIFISSPVAAPLPNVMGALLTVGTLLLIPVLGRRDLSRRPRVVEPACAERGQPVGRSRRSPRAQPVGSRRTTIGKRWVS